MRVWYKALIEKLQASGLFDEVTLLGAKVRASLDDTRFLDIHFDPMAHSYSYALIDPRLPYPGDKRVFDWDDYPHPDVLEIQDLECYPHHFQKRAEEGSWIFEPSLRCRAISSVKLTPLLPLYKLFSWPHKPSRSNRRNKRCTQSTRSSRLSRSSRFPPARCTP